MDIKVNFHFAVVWWVSKERERWKGILVRGGGIRSKGMEAGMALSFTGRDDGHPCCADEGTKALRREAGFAGHTPVRGRVVSPVWPVLRLGCHPVPAEVSKRCV